MAKERFFTSESVSDGHPDKVADQISDSILDFFIKKDKNSRSAIETLVTTNTVVLAGEIRVQGGYSNDDIEKLVRDKVKEIGYEQEGFHYQNLKVSNYLHAQSPDIARGVDLNEDLDTQGAGDQGIMFGYACDDTDVFMPFPIHTAHQILRNLKELRTNKPELGLLPDAKSQVTCKYVDGELKAIDTIVLSHQHEEGLTKDEIERIVKPEIHKALPQNLITDEIKYYINPTGKFVIGGPDGDTGLTGRKIIVDTYGGWAPHGGGAFSGKDYTKVDRSACYAMRYLSKNIVAAGLAGKCTLQISYAIGVAEPTSIFIDTHGTARVDEDKILAFIKNNIDLTPAGIRKMLDLNRPIYSVTASFGHFGREYQEGGSFTWENLNLTSDLKTLF